MKPLSRNTLTREYQKYGLDARLYNRKELLREARIYRILIQSLLTAFIEEHPHFSYDLIKSDYRGSERRFFDFSISIGSSVGEENFFKEFESYIKVHLNIIPIEYRMEYDAYIGSHEGNKGAIKISGFGVSCISETQYDTIIGNESIGLPHSKEKYFEFEEEISAKVLEILHLELTKA